MSASALAAATFALACAISSGRLPCLKSVDDGFLRGDLGLGLGDLRHQAAGLEAGEDLAFFDRVALLHQYGGDPAAVVEGKLGLPEIDIAVENELRSLPLLRWVYHQATPAAPAITTMAKRTMTRRGMVHLPAGPPRVRIAVTFSVTTRLILLRSASPIAFHPMRRKTSAWATRKTRI